MSVLDTDNFTGTDGTSLPTYDAAAWKNPNSGTYNDLFIKTNAVRGANIGNVINISTTWPNDQYSQAVVVAVTPTGSMYVTTRWTDGQVSVGYGGGALVSGSLLYRIIRFNDAATLAIHGSQNITIGDVVRLQAVGTTIKLFVNTIEILSAIDSTHVSGNAGLFIDDAGATNPMWDTWEGGSISTDTPITGLRPAMRVPNVLVF